MQLLERLQRLGPRRPEVLRGLRGPPAGLQRLRGEVEVGEPPGRPHAGAGHGRQEEGSLLQHHLAGREAAAGAEAAAARALVLQELDAVAVERRRQGVLRQDAVAEGEALLADVELLSDSQLLSSLV